MGAIWEIIFVYIALRWRLRMFIRRRLWYQCTLSEKVVLLVRADFARCILVVIGIHHRLFSLRLCAKVHSTQIHDARIFSSGGSYECTDRLGKARSRLPSRLIETRPPFPKHIHTPPPQTVLLRPRHGGSLQSQVRQPPRN
jgi:hypothetical protein